MYNERKRALFSYMEKTRKIFSYSFSHLSTVFMVDLTPILTCKYSRARCSNIVNYLKDIKYQFENCTLIVDRGYIGQEYQLDLFNESKIKLSVSMCKNQVDFQTFSWTKSKVRKRIETAFSQLCSQFLIQINLSKTFQGLATRITSKIRAFTIIQYLNTFVFNKSYQ